MIRPALAASAAAALVASGAASAAPPAPQQRLTVGGTLLSSDGEQLHLSGELVCNPTSTGASNLVVRSDDGLFRLTELVDVECTGDGRSEGGSLQAVARGHLDGRPATLQFRLTDGGAARPDSATVSRDDARVGAGVLEAGSIRMGKSFNHVEAAAR